MAIVAGFDVHRRQITFDALDAETGEVMRARIDAAPAAVSAWANRFEGVVKVAVEACTGWLFICDALAAAGAEARLAEPVETRALRGRKRRAKTDPEDARWLREPLADGRLPEAWMSARARAAVAVASPAAAHADRRAHAMDAAHPGDAVSPRRQRNAGARAHGRWPRLPRVVGVARRRARTDRDRAGNVDAIDAQIAPLERELRRLARRQTGCRALMRLYGMGELTSLITLCELGDVQRLSASRKAVRIAGIDIGVHRSDRRSRVGKLPGHLRRPTAPSHHNHSPPTLTRHPVQIRDSAATNASAPSAIGGLSVYASLSTARSPSARQRSNTSGGTLRASCASSSR
jgi:transposase